MGKTEKLLGEPGGHQPERERIKKDAGTPFIKRQEGISDAFVAGLLASEKLIRDIRREGYPTDERRCSAIGHTHGLGAEQIARASVALREQDESYSKQLH